MLINTIKFSELTSSDRWIADGYLTKLSGELKPLELTPETQKLGDLFTVVRDYISPQQYPDTEYSYIGIKNVENESGELIGDTQFFGSEVRSRSQKLKNNHVLYGRIRPLKNKVFLAENLSKNTICSLEFYVLAANENKVTPRILKAILSSALVLRQVQKLISGAAIPRVAISDLSAIIVPVISQSKQCDLERSLRALDSHKASLKKALDIIPSKMESILNQSFEGN